MCFRDSTRQFLRFLSLSSWVEPSSGFKLELPTGEARQLAKSIDTLVSRKSGSSRVPHHRRTHGKLEFSLTERHATQTLREPSSNGSIEVFARKHLSARQSHLSVLRKSLSGKRADVGSRRTGIQVRSQRLDERRDRVPLVQSSQRKSHAARCRHAASQRTPHSVVASGFAARILGREHSRRVARIFGRRLK